MRGNYIDRLLVLSTLGVVAIVCAIFGTYMYGKSSPTFAQFNSPGQLHLGEKSAQVEVVIFEEIRCTGCYSFNQEIFPQLKTKYIDTGKVKYVMVPVSFFEGTKDAANAAISVYQHHPERFLPYIERLQQVALRRRVKMEVQTLLQCASDVGGIDLAHLKRSILGQFFYKELDQNLQLARDVMNGRVKTPALFINGEYCPAHLSHEVLSRIDQALQENNP